MGTVETNPQTFPLSLAMHPAEKPPTIDPRIEANTLSMWCSPQKAIPHVSASIGYMYPEPISIEPVILIEIKVISFSQIVLENNP